MRPPQRGSNQERDEHERTHLPFRDRCDICVKARGRRVAHRRENEQERGQVPRVSMDYFYMSSKDEQDGKSPLVLMVDEETGDKYARMVEKKRLGSDGEMEWLVRDMSEELKSWGHVGKNFCSFCVSCEVFVLHGYEWIQVLHQDCISTIVSRFTTFTENL